MSDAPPTRTRYVLVFWLCGLSSLLYLDRTCMSKAVKPIRVELDLSKSEISLAMMAFTLAYGLCAVPAGWLGDKYGARLILALLVGAWSLFTGATGLVVTLGILIVVRFLFGAAEAGAFPNAARVIKTWFPLRERGRVQGIMLSFAQIGGIVAPTATGYLIEAAGWRWVFGIFGFIGLIWAAGFWFWHRNDPSEHSGVNAAELTEIRDGEPPPPLDPGPVPWAAIARNRGIIALGAIMVLASFFTYFFYSWFPSYLEDARGVSNVDSGWLTSLAIAGSALGMLVGGWLSDRVTRQCSDPMRMRRHACAAAFLIAAAFMFVGTRCDSPLGTTLFWSAAMCAMHIQLPNWWSAIIPQSGMHTATIFAITNGVGVLGALASQGVVPLFADYQEKVRGLTGRETWDPIFDVYVLVLIGGAIAWWLYRFTPLDESNEA